MPWASAIAAIVGTAATVVSGVISGVQGAEANATAGLAAQEQQKLQEKAAADQKANAAWDRKFQFEQAGLNRESVRQQAAAQAKQLKKQEFADFSSRLTKRAATDIQFKEALWALWGK